MRAESPHRPVVIANYQEPDGWISVNSPSQTKPLGKGVGNIELYVDEQWTMGNGRRAMGIEPSAMSHKRLRDGKLCDPAIGVQVVGI